MRRFKLIVLWATVVSQGPFVALLVWLLGRAAPAALAIPGALAAGGLSVWLLRGRTALLFEDRPIGPLRALAERVYYTHWGASLLAAPLALVAALVALVVHREPLAWASIAYVASLVVALYAVFVRPALLRVRTLDVVVPRLPPAFDGYRIAQLSDLHVGSLTPASRVERWVRVASALAPDAIVLTGDYVTSGTRFHVAAAALLSKLSARDGVFAVCGNHDDYGHGEPLRSELRRGGVRLFENEHATIERDGSRLALVGVDDTFSRRADVDRALVGIDPSLPIVALAHDPETFEKLARRGVALVLSGHTHWGQVALPFVEERVNLASRFYRHHAGLYRAGESTLYVHPGLGMTGPPLRFGVAPEITVLRLRTDRAGADVTR